jgi:hypothetical protein
LSIKVNQIMKFYVLMPKYPMKSTLLKFFLLATGATFLGIFVAVINNTNQKMRRVVWAINQPIYL